MHCADAIGAKHTLYFLMLMVEQEQCVRKCLRKEKRKHLGKTHLPATDTRSLDGTPPKAVAELHIATDRQLLLVLI